MPPKLREQDDNEYFLLNEIARQVRVCFDRRAAHMGLTRAQWQALRILRRHPGIRQAQMAELLEVEPISLVRLLDRMERAGWVERRSDPEDRRANQLYLTPKVKKVIERMRAIAISVRRDALEGFTDREYEELMGYLRRMKSNLTQMKCAEPEGET